ncbi:MAG: hypothetical protein JO368_04510, partial [Acidimicrobiales bacterium]|nr:hypothetical protein [Acidimicrobiales bacterium]
MPARTVVIERFGKFRGADASPLTAGEYQQLTGRAGRRGIDTVGHAFVLWSASTPFRDVARTALSPPPALESSFHPTYNLAVNLVRRWSREEAHALVAASYGQWQAPDGSDSLVAQLDRRLAVLGHRGFVDGWQLTADGAVLAGIYHESDLLVAEALRRGLLDGLAPPALSAVVSSLTYEPRRAEPPSPRVAPEVLERMAALVTAAEDLRADERRFGLRRTRKPEPGLAAVAGEWAAGGSLERVLERSEVAPGDFVRNVRQLVDLLHQMAQVAPVAGTREAASRAVRLLRRGVVLADEPAAAGSAPVPQSPS